MSAPQASVTDRLVAACGALLLAALVAFAGCGGGVGVGGTGAFASGPINGFGSIFVNGIEFDESGAAVSNDEGASTRSDLRLGMTVEVEGGPLGGTSAAPTATASTVRVSSEVAGPATAIDATAGTLSVLGQAVKVTAETVFDESFANGLASVADGTVVEVYGFADATGVTATRIEPRRGSAPFYRVRGTVSGLSFDTNSFSIGTANFSFSGTPAGLANGALVRLRVDTTPVNGRWVVLNVGDGGRRLPDTDLARLRGPITSFTTARQFSVNGQAVDASSASFPDGEAGLALAVRVRVEGPVAGGVLKATEVRVDDSGGAAGEFQLKGAIESIPATPRTFVLKGTTVAYASATFTGGSATDIAVGVDVDVRGTLAGNGSRLQATQITIVRKP